MKVYISQFVGPTTFQSMPLAAGLLAASARRDPRLREAVEFRIVTSRIDPDDAVDRYIRPDILAFSCYSWNERYTLEVARRSTLRFPDALCVLGGPSVPRRPDSIRRYFEAHEFADVLVLGEGEMSFGDLVAAQLLENTSRSSLGTIPGLAIRSDVGAEPIIGTPRARMREFSESDSPYLDGTFDTLDEPLSPPINMAVLETNRGCPFSCTFCDWGQATQSRVYELPEPRIRRELDWIGRREIPFLYIIDANFGIRERDVRIIEYLTEVKRRTGYPTLCHFHLTKNARVRNLRTVELLKEADIECRMALSMQDFDPRVLEAVKRSNIKPERALHLRELCHEKGIPTFNELILGLPEQTYDAFCANVVKAMTPYATDTFTLYICRLLENSEMASQEHRVMFGLQTVHCVTCASDPHGSAHVDEVEELVISTSTMPPAAWRQAYRFGYLVSVCYNHEVLRTVLHDLQFVHAVDVVMWFEALLEEIDRAPADSALGRISELFERYICAIVSGGPADRPLPSMSSRRWSIEEALNLTIQSSEDFYDQAYEATLTFLKRRHPEIAEPMLRAMFDAQVSRRIATP